MSSQALFLSEPILFKPLRHVLRFGNKHHITHQVVHDVEIQNHHGKPVVAQSRVRIHLPNPVFKEFRRNCRKHRQSMHVRDCLVKIEASGAWSLIEANSKITPTSLMYQLDFDPRFGEQTLSLATFVTSQSISRTGFQPEPFLLSNSKKLFSLPLRSGAVLKVQALKKVREFAIATIPQDGSYVTLWGNSARHLIPRGVDLRENLVLKLV